MKHAIRVWRFLSLVRRLMGLDVIALRLLKQSWRGTVWGQIYWSDVCNHHCCLRLCVAVDVWKRTPGDQYRSGNLKVAFSVSVTLICLEDRGRRSLLHVSTYQHTRAVRKVSKHFEYLENRSRGLDVTWQLVRGGLTARLWTVTLPWG
jgi:hypothetical protein